MYYILYKIFLSSKIYFFPRYRKFSLCCKGKSFRDTCVFLSLLLYDQFYQHHPLLLHYTLVRH